MKRYEKMRSTFESLSTKAMSNGAFYDEVMSALSNLSLKYTIEDGNGLMSQNLNKIGKVYDTRITLNAQENIPVVENGKK